MRLGRIRIRLVELRWKISGRHRLVRHGLINGGGFRNRRANRSFGLPWIGGLRDQLVRRGQGLCLVGARVRGLTIRDVLGRAAGDWIVHGVLRRSLVHLDCLFGIGQLRRHGLVRLWIHNRARVRRPVYVRVLRRRRRLP